MAGNVLEPYTFSFEDANPASNGCSLRVWVSPNKRFATQNKQMYIRLHCLRKLCSVYGAVFRFVCRFRRTATILNKNRMFLPRKVGRKEKDFVLYRPSLGGRINLLYCFFWGIAAVMWMRYGYPLVLKLMKKVRSHIVRG